MGGEYEIELVYDKARESVKLGTIKTGGQPLTDRQRARLFRGTSQNITRNIKGMLSVMYVKEKSNAVYDEEEKLLIWGNVGFSVDVVREESAPKRKPQDFVKARFY